MGKHTKSASYQEHPKHQTKRQLNAAKYHEKISKHNAAVVINEELTNDETPQFYQKSTGAKQVNLFFRLLLITTAFQALGSLAPVQGHSLSGNHRNRMNHQRSPYPQTQLGNLSNATNTTSLTTPKSTGKIEPVLTVNELQSNCHVARLAFDIGSGGTKVKGAVINVCSNTEQEVYSKVYPIKYRADLDKSPKNEFSKEIQDAGFNVLAQAKQEFQQKIKQEHPDMPIESCGVATAAFRKAANGAAVAQTFSGKLDMPIDILTQDEEGKIAYQAALGKANEEKLSLKNPITWDVGGGSMQLTQWDKEKDALTMCGSEVASQTVFKLISDTMPSHHTVVGSDFSNEQLTQAIKLILNAFPPSSLACEKIVEAICSGSDVLAVGSFHNMGVKPLIDGVLGLTSHGYTQEDILKTLGTLLVQETTPELILKYHPQLTKEFIPNQFLDLLLTAITMEKMGIEQVKTMQINNADGLIFSGCPWRSPKSSISKKAPEIAREVNVKSNDKMNSLRISH